MTITKRPTKKPAATVDKKKVDDKKASAFIEGAPDAAAPPRRIQKGRKVQITLTISEPLLSRVDKLADQLGQSRAAVINLAVVQMLESGLNLDGGTAD